MSKERNTQKETKKKPAMTPKERKAMKRAKKAERQAGMR
jgi:hypothetical protein